MENCINYARLFQALNQYKTRGYEYVDLPWTVQSAVSDITKPEGRRNLLLFENRDKALVASAEQSFLQLSLNGTLPLGKYMGITPCFRDEIEDYTHGTYFMKIELFNSISPINAELEKMVNEASNFFNNFLPTRTEYLGKDEYDILSPGNIELGSYGIRVLNGFSWIYGTGLAEPRFSIACKNHNGITQPWI